MNKFSKILLPVLSVAIALASCSTDEAPVAKSASFPADGVIRLTAQVGEMRSRSGWNNDNFSADFILRITNEVDTNYSYYVTVKKDSYTHLWTAYKYGGYDVVNMLWKNSTQPVKVAAVSSLHLVLKDDWKSADFSIEPNQQNPVFPTDMNKSDLLRMPETVINPATDLVDGKLVIKFEHVLSKLNIHVKLGTEFNPQVVSDTITPFEKCIVSGTQIKAYSWNIYTNQFSMLNLASDVQNTIPVYLGFTRGIGTTSNTMGHYDCIVIPQTIAAGKFDISIAVLGKIYHWTAPADVTFESGKAYDLQLNLGKDMLTLGSITTTPWTETAPIDKDTE